MMTRNSARALFPFFLFFLCAQAGATDMVDRIVAVVDEEPILESELLDEMEVIRQEPSFSGRTDTELRAIALDKIVGDRLILAEAKADNIAPSDEEVEDALQTSLQRMRSQFQSEDAFKAALDAEGVTLAKLRDRYRSEVEKTLTIRMVVDRKIRPGIDVSDEEVVRFYEENLDRLPEFPARYALGQIFIEPAPSEAGEAAMRAELLDLRRRVVEGGEDFADLARSHSDGPSAKMGGDLGFFGKGDMVAPFEKAAFALAEPGEVSDVVRTPFGLHIIQLVAREGDRIRVRHILKTFSAGDEERLAARKEAEAVHDSLLAGGDFAKLAAAHSDDPKSASRGGDIGTFAATDVSPDVNKALEGLGVGDYSDVVEAEDGFHIFKLLGRYDAGKPSLEEAFDDIRAAAGQSKQQEAYDRYVENLKKEFYVRIL